jgi:hypothetical protein
MDRVSKMTVACGLLFGLVGGAAGGYVLLSAAGISDGRLSKERALCDQAVDTLLTTKDLVELQRAMFLVRRLDCGVTRRLP